MWSRFESLQVNKFISELARNRARNGTSNCAEILHIHRRLHTGEGSEVLRPGKGESASDEVESASCARADARTVDHDVMMKVNIAKNEEGLLRRTLKVEMKNENERHADKTTEGDHLVTAGRHPGLDERLKILETHLAMRHGKICLSRADMIELLLYVKSTVASVITPSSHYLLKITSFNSSANILFSKPCNPIDFVGV